MRLNNIYESGRTVRFHANPNMNHLGQSVADHTWGMIALLFALHPAPTPELIGFITFHDSEERWIGDIPYPVKRAMPDLVRQHEAMGQIMCRQHGIPHFTITDEEKEWVRLLDRLECHMYAKLHGKLSADWSPNREAVMEAAGNLGIIPQIMEIMNDD